MILNNNPISRNLKAVQAASNPGRRRAISCFASLFFLASVGFAAEGGNATLFAEPDWQAPRFELAQVNTMSVPQDDEVDSAVPDEGSSSVPEDTPELPDSTDDVSQDTEFVFAGDLAITLRKIDPDAKVDWSGKKLVIKANGQEFSVFPTGQEMVVNGNVESGVAPLKIRNGEIYVPKSAISKIGAELEKKTNSAALETTTTIIPTPTPGPAPTPTPTPGPSILPDETPGIATPTPAGATTVEVLPSVTPAATAVPAGDLGPSDQPVATPFPQATPTPTPAPTPTPRPTAKPIRTDEEQESSTRNSTLSTESFKAVLRDKVSISTHEIEIFNASQLEKLAAIRNVTKVVIHADEGGLEREDQYGKECARISLAIARKLKAELEGSAIDVVLTRDNDEGITAGEAAEKVTKSNAQVLVVVSVGYSTAFKDLGGYRVFYMNESVDYNSLRQRSYDASEAVPSELNYKSFQAASKVLASSVKNSISVALDREPVGMNPIPDFLIRRAPMAGAAVVVGYLSNPADAQRLTDSAQQDVMAKALAEGILNYGTQLSQGKAGNEPGGL